MEITELQQKLHDLENFYGQRNVNFLAWRNLYFMREESIWRDENDEYVPPEPDEVRITLPIALNVVEGFRELLLTKPPAISVPPPTASGKELIDAEHNERTLLAIWDRAEIYDRLRDSLWHGLVDGWGVLQLLWDKDAKDWDSPIKVLHHDPYNVFPMPGSQPNTWKYVIHAYPRLAGQVREEWQDAFGTDGRIRRVKVVNQAFENVKDTDKVTFIDYWDDEVNGVAISYSVKDNRGNTHLEARWVKEPTPHKYGFLPWEIYLPFRLPFQSSGEEMGTSAIYPIQELIAFKDKAISQKATYLGRYQDPPLVTKTELGPDFEPVRTERGMHLRLRQDEDAGYLMHPGPMPQIDTLLQQVDEVMDAASLPKVLQGQYVGAVSGIAMSLLRNPTLMKVGFRQKEIERACENLNMKILKLLEAKMPSKPSYMWGGSLNGENVDVMIDKTRIGGYYRNEVKLSASLPTDDANTVNMLATLVQLNVLSRQTARDVAQQTLHDLVPQSLIDEEQRIVSEMVYGNPGFVESLAMELAERINLPYMRKQENPRGGRGEREVTMPSNTIPSQTPGMPGGNTQPDMGQRLQEMVEQAPSPTGTVNRVQEPVM